MKNSDLTKNLKLLFVSGYESTNIHKIYEICQEKAIKTKKIDLKLVKVKESSELENAETLII